MSKRYEAITADCNILDHKTQDYLDSEQIATLLNEREELEAENKFLKSFLQCHSPKMDGNHSYRWQGGWLTNRLRGPSVDIAVKNAMAALKSETQKMKESENKNAKD